MTTSPAIDLAAVKATQQATWTSGDYAAVASTIVPIAERLVDAADLRAGSAVLDVATGSGNAAIAAARLGCDVTGLDYVPELLDRARERSAAEHLPVTYVEGDAEALPFPAGSFDAVLSVVGSMFAPDHEQTAAEIARVCRPGGRIGLASWAPDGFIGELFKTVGRHVPPPAGIAPPPLWGTQDHLEELFDGHVRWSAHERRTFTFRFRTPGAFADFFAVNYGPTLRALAALGEDEAALRGDLEQLAASWNRLDASDGAIAIPSTYLESVGERV
jgi:SAM-dependent methyltransferase